MRSDKLVAGTKWPLLTHAHTRSKFNRDRLIFALFSHKSATILENSIKRTRSIDLFVRIKSTPWSLFSSHSKHSLGKPFRKVTIAFLLLLWLFVNVNVILLFENQSRCLEQCEKYWEKTPANCDHLSAILWYNCFLLSESTLFVIYYYIKMHR